MDFEFSTLSTSNILNGDKFVICSTSGDINENSQGAFRSDTRFLSRFQMKINGKEPVKLSSKNTSHFSISFYLTNGPLPSRAGGKNTTIAPRSLVIERKRFLRSNINEEFTILNVSDSRLELDVSFELGADFEDLFEVKDQVYANKKKRWHRRSLRHSSRYDPHNNSVDFCFQDKDTNFEAETIVYFSKKGVIKKEHIAGGQFEIAFKPRLRPGETFSLQIAIIMRLGEEADEHSVQRRENKFSHNHQSPLLKPEQFEQIESRLKREAFEWKISPVSLSTDCPNLLHTFRESMIDILSLKMDSKRAEKDWHLLAAGCPWYMTLFGRDSLITSFQSLPFTGELARGTLRALAYYQAEKREDARDAEPGKILHEVRYGDYAARSGRYPYYGTIDATPLFVITVSELFRWTGDEKLVEDLKGNILRALDWIDNYGDRDKDGFVEYERRTPHGLVNQCWKDSWNSIQFSDGRIASPPIASCEVQGYVYDAKMRIAEIARNVWKDRSLSKKLLDEANELKELFNERFWIEDKGYYALALDGEKNKVDSMTSNNGQLLWSGIVSEERATRVAEKLLDESMFTGFGIRTLSTKDRGFDPIGYHTGCVWAHDNSLIISGLARYGENQSALKVIQGILDASSHFRYILPEAFAGFQRRETDYPVRYPNACSPQGWASGATFLILKTLLGLEPRSGKVLVNPIIKANQTNPVTKNVELSGLRAFGKSFHIKVALGCKPEVSLEGQENGPKENVAVSH